MTSSFKFISFLTLLFCLETLHAQAILPAQRLAIAKLIPDSLSLAIQETPPDSIEQVMATLPLEYELRVTLADTTGITAVSVKLGTTQGGGELVTKTFAFDGPAINPDGTTWRRIGKTVWMKVGTFQGIPQVYAQVRLADASGLLTVPVIAQQ